MNEKNSNENNIFEVIQQKYSIKEVAEKLGINLHKVGSSYRADSIAGNGEGRNAFTIYEQSNTWFDFMLNIGGDVTDLVAYVKYNGDKKAAVRELMPELQHEKSEKCFSEIKKFNNDIEYWHKVIFDTSKKYSVKALEYLHSRKITDETIRELKIGIESWNGSFRIKFPYFWKDGKSVIYYVSRRYDWQGKGQENENEPKYKKASLQTHTFLKNSILGLNTLNRGRDELIITEGMFDWLHCYQQGYSVISPNGTDFGKLMPEVIEIIKSQFKKVILAFDTDEAGQDATYKVAHQLLLERIPFKVFITPYGKDVADFCELGGKVETIINSAREGKKWAIEYIRPKKNFEELTISEREQAMEKCKDFIKTISPYTDSADIHEILIHLRAYFPKEWVSELFKIAKKGTKEADVRDNIYEEHKLLYNEKTGFYEFGRKGIWEHKDDTEIQAYISREYGRNVTGGKLTSTLKVLKADERIYSDDPIKKFNKRACVVFLNGTLYIDMKTGQTKFLENCFREEDYVTVRLPYCYNSNADCKNWKKFIKEVTGNNIGSQKVLQEFSGYVLSPNCKYQKALMLKGEGSNGKGVFTNTISAVLGGTGDGFGGYISAVEPSRFSKDFRLMPFKDSWLNISTEAETDLRGGEGVFKKIVAGEILEDSHKHKDPFPFKTRTKLAIACNAFPQVQDTTEGFMRRWLIVNFPMHYVETNRVQPNSNDRPIDRHLEEKLMSELPGIFNWMIEGLQRLIQQDAFTETEENRKLVHEFMRANNHLLTFAEDNIKDFEGKTVQRYEVFNNYRGWAEKNSTIPLPANRFYSNLKGILGNLGVKFVEYGRKWTFEFPENFVSEKVPSEYEGYEDEVKELEKLKENYN